MSKGLVPFNSTYSPNLKSCECTCYRQAPESNTVYNAPSKKTVEGITKLHFLHSCLIGIGVISDVLRRFSNQLRSNEAEHWQYTTNHKPHMPLHLFEHLQWLASSGLQRDQVAVLALASVVLWYPPVSLASPAVSDPVPQMQ